MKYDCSKLTIKTPERRHWRRFGLFIVNFEHNSHLFLVLLLLILNKLNVSCVILALFCFCRKIWWKCGINYSVRDMFQCNSRLWQPILSLWYVCLLANYRSIHERCFIKKAVLKKFAMFTGKDLCLSLFLIQFLWKRDSDTGVFLWILQNC